ncbi:sulfite exporter TauE/SafE family protein [Ferruginibacter paludis]|uniref:sulfite exporter TauE/SafE family protein n=1 Tax=Ferruginibacter paludis TaxID=1310417 RepID=UPI0025B417AA|nr:sulfite exporter TauE/SafE family protein [Ferruginibacter paludis]MDN3656514.1 sulfite exporter TauE/SafE family protein [Ferruginibacter paludis]
MIIAGYFLMALVGISLGLIGGGGSILTVPILVYAMGVNPLLATSYSLFIVGTTSIAGAANNYRRGFVDVKTALLFGLSSITTVFVTRKIILPAIPEVLFSNQQIHFTQSMAIMVLFAVLMLSASIAMIKNKANETRLVTADAAEPVPLIKLLLFGVAVGLTTGLLGAGGGFLLIPALVLLLRMPMKKAVGTSLLIIALNSLIGFTGDIGHFNIDWHFLITLTLIAVAGIFTGGILAKKIDGVKLKKAFGWFVLLMGIYILMKELFFTSPVH